MSEEDQVAPEAATEEGVTYPEAEGAEPPKDEKPKGEKEDKGQEKDPPAEDKADDAGSEEKTEAQKRRERRKAQMQRLQDEAREADRRYREQQARLEKAKQAAQSTVPPKEADFSDYNEYLVAVGAYHAARNLDSRQSQEIEEAAEAEKARVELLNKQRDAELAQGWAEQVAEAKGKYADFEAVAFTAPISDQVAQMIAASDAGADVAYYLGSNPEQARQISGMHPIEAARELGRIEARLSAPPPRTKTAAPDPITPVRTASNASSKSPDAMTPDEYRKWRESGGTF